MFCPTCGTQVQEHANFCNPCGHSFNENRESDVHNVQHKDGLVYKILGWLFFAISLLFFPVIFAAGAFIMGYLLRKSGPHNETHGTILMVMAVAGGIFGMLLGMAVAGF